MRFRGSFIFWAGGWNCHYFNYLFIYFSWWGTNRTISFLVLWDFGIWRGKYKWNDREGILHFYPERERERIFCNFIVLAAYHPLCLEYLDHVFTCESEISQLSEWSAAIKFVLCKYEPWCNWKPSAFALDTRHDRTIQKPENVRVFILIPAHFKSFKTYLNEWPFVACHTLSNKFFLHFRSGYSPKVLLSRFVFRDKGNTLC